MCACPDACLCFLPCLDAQAKVEKKERLAPKVPGQGVLAWKNKQNRFPKPLLGAAQATLTSGSLFQATHAAMAC